MKPNKKGQSLTLGSIPDVAFALGVGAVIVAVLALVLVEMNRSITPVLNSQVTNTSMVHFDEIIGNGTGSLLNMTGQLPLIGTIAGLVILIGLVVAAFKLR